MHVLLGGMECLACFGTRRGHGGSIVNLDHVYYKTILSVLAEKIYHEECPKSLGSLGGTRDSSNGPVPLRIVALVVSMNLQVLEQGSDRSPDELAGTCCDGYRVRPFNL